jgi:hypothetical protein
MRDVLPETLAAVRARAEELVAGWLNGTASDRPPADALRMETLADDGNVNLCFCLGTFCWPAAPLAGQA